MNGTFYALYLYTRFVKQLPIDEEKMSLLVLKAFYVNDVLSEKSILERAKNLQSQLIEHGNLGNINFHEWCENHQELLPSEKWLAIEYSFDDHSEAQRQKPWVYYGITREIVSCTN